LTRERTERDQLINGQAIKSINQPSNQVLKQ
jgi:hypothetical protein